MNSLDRVLSTLQGKNNDKTALSLTLSLYGAKMINADLKNYYTDAELYFKGQAAVASQCRSDILFTPFVFALEAQAFGCELTFFKNYPPNVRKPAIKTLHDAACIEMPDILENKEYQYISDATSMMADHFKGDIPIAGVITLPVDLPATILGIDLWLEILLFHEGLAGMILDQFVEHFIAWGKRLVECGADFLVFPAMLVNPHLMMQQLIEEKIAPIVTDALAQLEIPVVFHHGGNIMSRTAGYFKDVSSVAAFVIDPRDSFESIRKEVGFEKVLIGNLNGPALHHLSEEQLYDMTWSLLANRKNDPFFILGSSGADISLETPLTHIAAIHRAIGDFHEKK